jgi:hypothetical protein
MSNDVRTKEELNPDVQSSKMQQSNPRSAASLAVVVTQHLPDVNKAGARTGQAGPAQYSLGGDASK